MGRLCASTEMANHSSETFRQGEPCFYAFGLLWCEGEDLRHLPLILGCHNHEYEFSGFTSASRTRDRRPSGGGETKSRLRKFLLWQPHFAHQLGEAWIGAE